jgi:hypothetical protein
LFNAARADPSVVLHWVRLPSEVEKKNKMGDDARWHHIGRCANPSDGERVVVRQQHDTEELLVIFRATPVPRWESLDGVYVWAYQFFVQWRSR